MLVLARRVRRLRLVPVGVLLRTFKGGFGDVTSQAYWPLCVPLAVLVLVRITTKTIAKIVCTTTMENSAEGRLAGLCFNETQRWCKN